MPMSKLKVRIPTWEWVDVTEVKSLRWTGPTDQKTIAKLPCTACGLEVGFRRIAITFVRLNGIDQSMRLCEECGAKAECDKNSQPRAFDGCEMGGPGGA